MVLYNLALDLERLSEEARAHCNWIGSKTLPLQDKFDLLVKLIEDLGHELGRAQLSDTQAALLSIFLTKINGQVRGCADLIHGSKWHGAGCQQIAVNHKPKG